MMDNKIGIIAILVVVAIALFFVLRSCKHIEVKQKSSDDKTQISLEVQKERY